MTLAVTVLGMGAPLEEGTWHGIWVYVEPDDETSPAFRHTCSTSRTGRQARRACSTRRTALVHGDPEYVTCTRSGDTVTWRFSEARSAPASFSFFAVAWHLSQSGGVPGPRIEDPTSAAGDPSRRRRRAVRPQDARRLRNRWIDTPSATPARPVAGKTFSLIFAVRRGASTPRAAACWRHALRADRSLVGGRVPRAVRRPGSTPLGADTDRGTRRDAEGAPDDHEQGASAMRNDDIPHRAPVVRTTPAGMRQLLECHRL